MNARNSNDTMKNKNAISSSINKVWGVETTIVNSLTKNEELCRIYTITSHDSCSFLAAMVTCNCCRLNISVVEDVLNSNNLGNINGKYPPLALIEKYIFFHLNINILKFSIQKCTKLLKKTRFPIKLSV